MLERVYQNPEIEVYHQPAGGSTEKEWFNVVEKESGGIIDRAESLEIATEMADELLLK